MFTDIIFFLFHTSLILFDSSVCQTNPQHHLNFAFCHFIFLLSNTHVCKTQYFCCILSHKKTSLMRIKFYAIYKISQKYFMTLKPLSWLIILIGLSSCERKRHTQHNVHVMVITARCYQLLTYLTKGIALFIDTYISIPLSVSIP